MIAGDGEVAVSQFRDAGRFAVIVAALIVVVSGSSAFAQPAGDDGDSANARPSEQRYDKLFQRMLDEPLNLDVMFSFARTAAQLGRTEQAISTLERMLLVNPNLPRVKLELGALYYRLGSYQAARGYFEQVESDTGLPPQVRQRVEAYLDRIEDQDSRHAFSFGAFFGARYQTNATAGTDSEFVQTPFGLAELDDEFREQADINLFATGSIRHSYDLQTGQNESWDSTLLGYSARQRDFARLDLDVLEATTGPSLAVLPAELDDATLRPYGKVSHIRLGRNELFTAYGGGLETSALIGQRAAVSGSYELLYNDYETSAARPLADQSS